MTTRRSCFLAAPLLLALALAGCSQQAAILGLTGGTLFQGFDALAYPGDQVKVTARLQGGDFLQGLEGYLVGFYQLDRRLGQARTDQDGNAEIEVTAPAAGHLCLLARLEDPDVRKTALPAAEIIVAARPKEARMIVVDLDQTIVGGTLGDVLARRAPPIADSQAVLTRAAKDYTIVYLTDRSAMFTAVTKNWLRQYDYPLGPLLTNSPTGFLVGSEKFKTAALKALKARYPAIQWGIGDQPGDARAYTANGLTPILLLHPEKMTRPEDVRLWIHHLQSLPAGVEAVDSWPQVEQVLYAGAHYPPTDAVQRLTKKFEAAMQEMIKRSEETGQ